MTLDPTNMTLADLKAKNLTRGPSFDIIKQISEVAMKEHNIKTSLDLIDREIQDISYELTPYKDTTVWIMV